MRPKGRRGAGSVRDKSPSESLRGGEPGAGEEAAEDPRVDPVREALATTWWGANPWRRYLRLLAVVGPALVLGRVAAVTDFSRVDSWLILSSLDLGQWLQILTGSFVAWHPWSLLVAVTGLAAFGSWSFTEAVFALGVQELRRGSPVTISHYGQLGALAASAFLPLLGAVVAQWALPRSLSWIPALGAVAGWLAASERFTDGYRLARQEFASRKIGKNGGGVLGDLIPYVSSLRLRVRAGLLEKAVSWLISLGIVATLAVIGLIAVSRTPWVPEACITYQVDGKAVQVEGFLLVEGQSRDVVLRAADREVVLVAGVSEVRVQREGSC